MLFSFVSFILKTGGGGNFKITFPNLRKDPFWDVMGKSRGETEVTKTSFSVCVLAFLFWEFCSFVSVSVLFFVIAYLLFFIKSMNSSHALANR